MIAFALIAALLIAPVGQDDTDAPATPAQIAEARRHADALIQVAEAADLFENISADAVPTIRHRASGMTCAFSGDRRDYIHVFHIAGDRLPRGDDVACGMWFADAEYTTYATRYPGGGHSARADLESAVEALTTRLPDARPHEGDLPLVSREGGAEILLAGYDVTIENRPRLSLILVARVDDWNFKQRATAPREDTTMPLYAGMSFMLGLPGGRD